MTTNNNTSNVSVGKGVQGGYFFYAPSGSTLPSGLDSVPGEDWTNGGYIGSDGVTFSDSQESESFTDMNGDVIATGGTTIEKTVTFQLVEIMKGSLELIYGIDNVDDSDGVVTVQDKGANETELSVAFYFLLKDGRRWVRVGEKVTVGELGDLQVNYENLVGREVTLNVLKGDSGNYWKDWYDSTETASSEDDSYGED